MLPAMPPPVRITVGQEPRSYGVEIGEGLGGLLWALLDRHGISSRRVVVSTAPIWRLVEPALQVPAGTDPVLVPDGERFKLLSNVARIHDGLLKAGADRGTTVVAVGGGVLGDTAGFAAATYMRGIPLVHVPTTLVAQVDSAIGGKVGVNHPLAKNLIGAFHPPRVVVVDPSLLATLARREFRAGLYEVIKYAIIASGALFATVAQSLSALLARDPGVLIPVIAECCHIKARIVTADEFETGQRRLLNLGHTVGHALESVTKYRRFRHGEAVGYGIVCAARMAEARGALTSEQADAIARLVAQLGPVPPVGDLSSSDVLETIRYDKKVVDGRLHFVLPTGIGAAVVVDDVTSAEIGWALACLGLRPGP